MKKNILFIAAIIFVFCIVPIATTQAMPQLIQRGKSFASTEILYVLNQKELRNMGMGLNNPGNEGEEPDDNDDSGQKHAQSRIGKRSHLKKPEPTPYIVDDDEPDNDVDSVREIRGGRTGALSHRPKPEPDPYIVDDEDEEDE